MRALFARSGNQCAFPGCTQALINDRNQLIGQICHIEAALPGGERYNPEQTDEQRRSYDNLLLLCYPHHIETDNVTDYPVERLHKIKRDHEALFEKSDFKIDEAALFKIIVEMERYWLEIERINKFEHEIPSLAFQINACNDYFMIRETCDKNVEHLESIHRMLWESDESLQKDFETLLEKKGIDLRNFDESQIPHYENPFINRNWELHALSLPNAIQQLRIDLMHMEIKYLEEYLKTNSKSTEARKRLQDLKASFAELAQYAIIRD